MVVVERAGDRPFIVRTPRWRPARCWPSSAARDLEMAVSRQCRPRMGLKPGDTVTLRCNEPRINHQWRDSSLKGVTPYPASYPQWEQELGAAAAGGVPADRRTGHAAQPAGDRRRGDDGRTAGQVGASVAGTGPTHLARPGPRGSDFRWIASLRAHPWLDPHRRAVAGPHGPVHLPRPGGDVIGRRRVDTHFMALRLGADVDADGCFCLNGERLVGADILLDEASVTGTENAVMAAVLAKGTTIIRNAACEPHVQDLCTHAQRDGGEDQGIGTNTLVIDGVERLHGVDFTVGPITSRWGATSRWRRRRAANCSSATPCRSTCG